MRCCFPPRNHGDCLEKYYNMYIIKFFDIFTKPCMYITYYYWIQNQKKITIIIIYQLEIRTKDSYGAHQTVLIIRIN